MAKLADVLAKAGQKVVVTGDPGSGKSTLAAKLAEEGFKLIWASCDNGHSVLRKLSPAAQANVELIVLPDTRDYPIAWDTVSKLVRGGSFKICDAHGSTSCTVCSKVPTASYTQLDLIGQMDGKTILVIDTGTEVGNSCMNVVCKGKAVDYKPQLDDWGSLKFNLTKFMKDIQAAPFHILMLCQPQEAKMEDNKTRMCPMIGSYEFGRVVGGYFDHMVYLEVSNRAHKGGSASTWSSVALTKSRTDVEIEKMPTMSLAPFFDGTVAAAKGTDQIVAAKPVLTAAQEAAKVSPVVATKPVVATTTATPPAQQPAQQIAPAPTLTPAVATLAVATQTPAPTPAANAAASSAKDLLAKLKKK